ncbi:MAG: Putrescine aminotransferase [bacterium ADurb.Bin425]|nr:MAG: Putrescine aminotransferase [bacterium ADurb.Bin425]
MASAKVWKVLEPNPTIHNSTFGGNPLACSAASACVEVLLEEHLPARAAVMGNHFNNRLNELKERYPEKIADVRGRGLLIGLEFTSKELREAVQVELFHRGVLVAGTLNANRTFRIEPPLIITESQINFMVDTLEGILKDLLSGEIGEIEEVKQITGKKKREKKSSVVRAERKLTPVKSGSAAKNSKPAKGTKKSAKGKTRTSRSER